MYRFFQMLKRDLLNLLYNPMWVFFSLICPFIMVLLLGFLTKDNYGNSVTSYDYYGITMLLYFIFNSSTIASNSFMEERIKMGNMRIIFAPLPKSNIYISKILATFIFSVINHFALILAMHFVLGVNFGGKYLDLVIILLLLFELFASVLGVMLCCIFKTEKTANQVLSIVINISAVFGGLLFQLDGLGKGLAQIGYFIPVKWVVTAIFKLIYDNNFSLFLPASAIIIVLSIVGIGICKLSYRTEDYL